MRLKLAAVAIALLAVPLAGAATGIKATLRAPASQPVVDVKWPYSIKVTDLKGKPVKGTFTGVVIDPFGGVHPNDYGPSEPEVPLTNWPIRGTFRDYMIFPPSSRGFKLTLKWTIKVKLGGKTYRKVLTRKVTPG